MTDSNNVGQLKARRLNDSHIQPSSVKRITVIQAIDSKRVGPSGDQENNEDKYSDEQFSPDNKSSENIQVHSHSGSVYDKNPFLYSILGISGVFLGVFWATAYLFVPWHNHLEEPSYWYETLLLMVFVCLPLLTTKLFLTAYHVNGYKWENAPKVAAKVIVVASASYGACYVIMHVYWTGELKNCPPLSNITSWANLFGGISGALTMIWFQYPAGLRKTKKFRKRYFRYVTTFVPLMFCVYFVYQFYGIALQLAPENWQWPLAFVLPAFREFNVWGFTKLVSSLADDREKQSIGMFYLHDMATRHAIALCVVTLGGATVLTSFLLLGIDFVINIILAINIIRKKRNNPAEDVSADVQELMMAEKIEFVIPLMYYLTFLMGHYGPNANLFGTIGVKMWQHQSILNVDVVTYWLFIFFMIDCGSLVVSAALLWIFCRINCFQHYLQISMGFWITMAVGEAHWMNEVKKD